MATQTSVEELRNKMKQAAALEEQLQSLPKKSSEERSSRIRMQLCEILSDVMLLDPYFAMRKDCAGRLWRNCFYGRITQLRNRITREKRKNGPNLKKLESSLKVFLGEAIVLYRWIVNKYETKLLPQLPDSQMSQESSTSIVTPEDVAGVIPVLYRLSIHLGDLNRYAGSYKEAETCYVEASKLAPGKGNPYNQLAVVAQLKDTSAPLSCVSLYWYARSILAVNGPFETSGANLALLFELNRKWLNDHSEEPVVPASGTSKKALQEQSRAQKRAGSQRFLAQFVDLHYDFFLMSDKKEINALTLTDKLQEVSGKFSSLVDATAFGDALLIKMIAINAFSVHNLKGGEHGFETAMALLLNFGASLSQRVEKTLQKLVPATKQHSPAAMPSVRLIVPLVLICDYLFTFQDRHLYFEDSQDRLFRDEINAFWGGIASVANLLNMVRGQLHPSSLQHLRMKEYENLVGFTPFQSFVRNGKSKKDEAYVSADEAIKALELSPSPTQESAASVSSGSEEENRLKLMRLLQVADRFVRRWEKGDTGLLVRDEGGLYKVTSLPQDDAMDASDVDQMADFENAVDMKISVAETTEPTELPLAEGNRDEDDDDAGDVVMYKPSEGGTGPALLVPGPLLTNCKATIENSKVKVMPMEENSDLKTTSTETKPEAPATDSWKVAGDDNFGVGLSSLLQGVPPQVENRQPSLPAAPKVLPPTIDPMKVDANQHTNIPIPPPPGLLPPPGFATATASSAGVSLAATTPASQAPPPGLSVPVSAQQNPPPGFSAPSFSTQQNAHVQGFDLSNLSTANPFAAEYPQPSLESLVLPGSGIFGSAYGQSKPSPDFLDLNRKEDASLLDTSFLTNLWLEESQKGKPPLSDNPFLT